MTDKTIRVELPNLTWEDPKTFDELVAWFAENRDKTVPSEYHDVAVFSFELEVSYDAAVLNVFLSYDRPETAAEEASRLHIERENKQRRINQLQAELDRLTN